MKTSLLAGALALLAARSMAPDINLACYTFGAQRVGKYEYFQSVKTAVYRIVNSSDIVPRVSAGAAILALVLVVRAIGWLMSLAPVVSTTFGRAEAFLDKLNGYRHFGDQCYLSDVAQIPVATGDYPMTHGAPPLSAENRSNRAGWHSVVSICRQMDLSNPDMQE